MYISLKLTNLIKTISWRENCNKLLAAYGLLIVFSCNTVLAVEIENLYNAEITVAGQGSHERKKAIRQALERVIIKLTGSLQSTQSATLEPLFAQAEQYVEQFRYKEKETPPSGTKKNEGQNAPGIQQGLVEEEVDTEPLIEDLTELNLWVSFDSSAIKSELDKASVPYWGQTRPLVLIWLAVEEGAERFLLEKELQTELSDILQDRADFRGLPLAFPLMDLEDRAIIGISDVWGNFTDTIREASARYSVDAILVGRVNPLNSTWQARWTVYHNSRIHNWQSTQLELAELLKAGIDETVDSIAPDYIQVMSDEDNARLQLAVNGLTNFAQYSQLLNYLTRLDLVQNIRVKEISGTQVLLELQTRGSRKLFEQAVQLGRVLVPGDDLSVDEEQDDFILFDTEKEQAEEITPQTDLFYRLAL